VVLFLVLVLVLILIIIQTSYERPTLSNVCTLIERFLAARANTRAKIFLKSGQGTGFVLAFRRGDQVFN